MTERAATPIGPHRKRRRATNRAAWLFCGPAACWIIVFLLLPFAAVCGISFFSRGAYGEIQLPLTLENYSRLIGFGAFGFDAVYPLIFLKSVALAVLTTAGCVALGTPLAFFIAGLPPAKRTFALTLVIIPFWINLLIRTYAWQILFAPDSPVSKLALFLHVLEEDEGLYPGLFAVFVGTLADYLPYFVLPLYASVEKIDWRLGEAAMDLGAGRIGVFVHAVLPQILPGLAAGCVLVGIPAMGQFVVPDLLGGAKTALLGNAISQQFGPSRDWPLGAAISAVTMGVVLIALAIYARRAGVAEQEKLL